VWVCTGVPNLLFCDCARAGEGVHHGREDGGENLRTRRQPGEDPQAGGQLCRQTHPHFFTHCKSGVCRIETYFTKIVFNTVEDDFCIRYLTI